MTAVAPLDFKIRHQIQQLNSNKSSITLQPPYSNNSSNTGTLQPPYSNDLFIIIIIIRLHEHCR